MPNSDGVFQLGTLFEKAFFRATYQLWDPTCALNKASIYALSGPHNGETYVAQSI